MWAIGRGHDDSKSTVRGGAAARPPRRQVGLLKATYGFDFHAGDNSTDESGHYSVSQALGAGETVFGPQ